MLGELLAVLERRKEKGKELVRYVPYPVEKPPKQVLPELGLQGLLAAPLLLPFLPLILLTQVFLTSLKLQPSMVVYEVVHDRETGDYRIIVTRV